MAAIAPNLYDIRKYPDSEWVPGEDGQGLGAQNEEPVIDLVHLARQTMGDQALETELLDLFDRQSARIVSQLAAAKSGTENK